MARAVCECKSSDCLHERRRTLTHKHTHTLPDLCGTVFREAVREQFPFTRAVPRSSRVPLTMRHSRTHTHAHTHTYAVCHDRAPIVRRPRPESRVHASCKTTSRRTIFANTTHTHKCGAQSAKRAHTHRHTLFDTIVNGGAAVIADGRARTRRTHLRAMSLPSHRTSDY